MVPKQSWNMNLGEGTIAVSLEAVQERHNGITIGSYPYYHSGSFGVKLVLRGTIEATLDTAAADLIAVLESLGGNPYLEDPN